MEKWIKRAVELISGLALTNKADPSVIPYRAQKTELSEKEARYFKREKAERHGVGSPLLYKMLGELEAEPRANVHSLLVLKDGAVICECSAEGYGVNTRQLSHSMSKTVTGLAIGFLVDEGRLDLSARLIDILPEYRGDEEHPLFEKITVAHLLEMSSCVRFSEAGSVTDAEWCRAFFASKVTAEPGSEFKYNSMNSYILARIVAKIAGVSLSEFLSERLFAPLEIDNFQWELGPEGVEKGGWGLYLSPESWAKLGQLMLNRGMWRGERIISERWLSESLKTHSVTSEVLGDFNYGYHVWVGRESDEFLFSGMLGQNVWVCPKNNIVAVITSGNDELFQASPALTIIRKHLGGDGLYVPSGRHETSLLREKEARFFESRRWVRTLAPHRGLFYLLGFADPRPFDIRWSEMLGEYALTKNNCGILPVFVRVMQNNYTGGMESLKIESMGDALLVTSREGGREYSFPVGLYGKRVSVLDFRGEKYLVAASGAAVENEDGQPIFKIELTFPELPNTRRIKLARRSDGSVSVSMWETPNEKLTEPFVELLGEASKKTALALDFVKKRFGEDYIERKLASVFAPELVGVRTDAEGFEELIAAENEKLEAELGIAASLASLITRLVKPDEEEPKKRSFISDILGFFTFRRPAEPDNDNE